MFPLPKDRNALRDSELASSVNCNWLLTIVASLSVSPEDEVNPPVKFTSPVALEAERIGQVGWCRALAGGNHLVGVICPEATAASMYES